MAHMEMSQPSAHRVYLQQSTKEMWKFYTGDTTCACGNAEETTAQMLQCSQLAHHYSLDDLIMWENNAWNYGKGCFYETMMMMMIVLFRVCVVLE